MSKIEDVRPDSTEPQSAGSTASPASKQTERQRLAELRRKKVLEGQKDRWSTLGVDKPPPMMADELKKEVGATINQANIPTEKLMQQVMPSFHPATRAVISAMLGMLGGMGWIRLEMVCVLWILMEVVLPKQRTWTTDLILFVVPNVMTPFFSYLMQRYGNVLETFLFGKKLDVMEDNFNANLNGDL